MNLNHLRFNPALTLPRPARRPVCAFQAAGGRALFNGRRGVVGTRLDTSTADQRFQAERWGRGPTMRSALYQTIRASMVQRNPCGSWHPGYIASIYLESRFKSCRRPPIDLAAVSFALLGACLLLALII